MDSLWGILKKTIYQIFDILICCDFWTTKNAKLAKNAKNCNFRFLGAEKNQNITSAHSYE